MIELSARAWNCLWIDAGGPRQGFQPDPAKVAEHTRAEILMLPNCGRITLENIEAWLAGHGMTLKNVPPQPSGFPADLEFGA